MRNMILYSAYVSRHPFWEKIKWINAQITISSFKYQTILVFSFYWCLQLNRSISPWTLLCNKLPFSLPTSIHTIFPWIENQFCIETLPHRHTPFSKFWFDVGIIKWYKFFIQVSKFFSRWLKPFHKSLMETIYGLIKSRQKAVSFLDLSLTSFLYCIKRIRL